MVSMPVLRPRVAIRFAHPAELRVAQLLDSFGIRWLYEPTTFPLQITGDGRPIKCFTPDFYLPDHNVYVEMTTMRQSLVTRKNQKFRLMRELFPHLDVRLLYRKDVELITGRYGANVPVTENEIGKVIAVPDQIRSKAQDIARHLMGLGNEPVALIAIGLGAEHFRDLVGRELRALGRALSCETIHIKPPIAETQSSGLRIQMDPTTDLRCYRRILVADIVATGLTCWAARAGLEAEGIPIDGVVTLLERRSARLIEVPIHVPGIPAPSNWIVGAGMGRAEFARALPALHGVRA